MNYENDNVRVSRTLGIQCGKMMKIGFGASLRRFYRISQADKPFSGHNSVVAMVCDDQLALDLFLHTQRFFASEGIPVPTLLDSAPEFGVVILEDLGDVSVLEWSKTATCEDKRLRYEDIVRLLARINSLHPPLACPIRWLRFDREKYIYEFHFHVRRCLFERWGQMYLKQADAEVLERFFEESARLLATRPWVLVHRDFQSSNLMIDKGGNLRVIDFQDARLGAQQYDLVSLLYDSYVDFTEPERQALTALYQKISDAKDSAFARKLQTMIVQRKLHDAGAFSLAADNGKPEFLVFIQQAIRMALQALGGLPQGAAVSELLQQLIARSPSEALR